MQNASATIEEASAMRGEIHRLKDDLQRLRTDFAGLASDTAHAVKVGTAEAREQLRQKAKAAAEKGRESLDGVGEQIGAHPFIAVTAALAVGVIVGARLARRP